MKMNVFCRGISLVIAAALLLCGCSEENGGGSENIDPAEDISEETSDTTTTTAAATTTTTAAAAGEEPIKPDTLVFEDVYDTDENGVQSIWPVEYKLYLKDGATDESTLLYEHVKVGSAFYNNINFSVVDDAQQDFMIVHETGSTDISVAYTAQYGELEILGCIDLVKDDDGSWQDISEQWGQTLLVIRDGDCILRSFCKDMEPQFEELFVMENGIYDYDQPQSIYKEAFHRVYTASFAKDNFFFLRDGYIMDYTDEMMMEYFGHTLDDFYICPDCGYGYEYFIWADKDRNWFWYHPESGENEPIEVVGDLNYDVFIAKAE